MFTTLLNSCIRICRRRAPRRQRRTVVAQAPGQSRMLDCEWHPRGWSGVVKIQEASQERVVHVCIELRPTVDEALRDADEAAQRLALMFVQ